MQETTSAKRLELLDYARLGAALSVLAFHYFFNGIAGGKITSVTAIPALVDVAKYGYLGVEFFFLISGYVIFYTARNKSPGGFATSRAVRLYPAFWVALLLTASFATVLGGNKMAVECRQVLLNLTMVPKLLGVRPVDGVYWTLQMELQFYALVLLLLLLGLRRHLDRIFVLWPVLMLVASLAGRPTMPLLGGYYAFFAGGALFAVMRERATWPALGSLAICLFLAMSNSIKHAGEVADVRGQAYSAIAVGTIVACQFAFFFVLNTPRGLALRLPGSRLAGGLTYPVYLLHAHIGYMLLSRFATDANRALAYPMVIAFVFGLAWAVHELVERRLASRWHAVFSRTVGWLFDAIGARMARWAPEGRQAA